MRTKICSNCKVEKTIDEFEPAKVYADGFRGQCRACRNNWNISWRKRTGYKNSAPHDPKKYRERRLLKEFGLGTGAYDLLYESQSGRCAICQKKEQDVVHGLLRVDHCHTSGKVRGLLCASCNLGLGMFRDCKAALAQAIKYLDDKIE